MIGKEQIQIDSRQIASGLATSDFMSDGGIGSSSYNLSLISQPGVVRAMPTSTPTKSGATIDAAGIAASCESPETPTTKFYRWFVDEGGTVFHCDDTSYVDDSLSTLTGVSAPNSDMAVWTGPTPATYSYIYVSKTTNVVRLEVDNSNGALHATSNSWFSGTTGGSSLTSGVSHPLLVYEGSLWIGDGNLLKTASDATTGSTFLTLNSNERITCLGIDPQTGLMMIGVRTVSGTTDRYVGKSYVYLFDGYSPKPRRKIQVDGNVESFHPVGGYVYVGMNNTIGVWNGSGVTFLRRFYNQAISPSKLPFKNRVSSFQNTLLVAENTDIFAYGDIGNGKKAWWPFYRHPNSIYAIFPVGNVADSSLTPPKALIGVNDGSTLKYIQPTDTGTAATGVFQTNNINFERPVNIHRVRVFTTGITTTAGIGAVSIIDETGTVISPTQNKFVVSSGTKYVFDFDFGSCKLQTLQPSVTIDTQAFGVIRIVIYYDVAE